MSELQQQSQDTREGELFRLLVENVKDYAIFVIDPHGLVESWNPGAERLLGYSGDEMIGQPIAIIFTPEDIEKGIPQREMQESLEEGRGNDDRWHVRKDGSRFWCGGTMTPLWVESQKLRGFAKIMRDRTEWKTAVDEKASQTKEAERLRRLYDAALSNTPDFVCLFDLNHRITYANQGMLAIWGKTWEEAIGKNFLDLGYEPWLATMQDREIEQVIATKMPVKGEVPFIGTFGSRVYEYIFVPVFNLSDEVEAVAGTTRDITVRKRSEERLRESEQRFRQLADAMPQIVWTSGPEGNLDYTNGQWHEFTGLSENLNNESWLQFLHPDDVAPYRERWKTSIRSGAPFEMEARFQDRRKQTYRWHLVRIVGVHDDKGKIARWFGTSTDIHEQKRAETSANFLAEASAAISSVVDYESTLQKIADLAVPYFADWSAVDMANEDGSLRRLAVAHQDADKIRFACELMNEYPPDPQTPGGAVAVLLSGKPEIVGQVTDELLVRAAKDERHLLLIRSLGLKSYICVPLMISSKPIGVLTFATAESGRSYTNGDLALAMDLARRAAVAIENSQLYQELREADRRKDEFLATLAHELRNPLAPIHNSIQILKLPSVDAETVERTRDMMERQVHHLVRLVDDLMDVSRVMRGKIELRKEVVEMATIVSQAIETVQPLVDTQAHELKISLPGESLPLDVDPVRLVQVVGNLLTNAIKYTEPNGRISLTAQREYNEAVLRVLDNGIGIASDILPRIFELFVQVNHATTRSQGGLGIGLTLVKNLVEMHQGTVKAHSDGIGKGTEVVVRLPIASKKLHQVQAENREVPVRSPSLTGHRLLVVDDNQDAANSLAMLLSLQGHDVKVAHDGRTALEITKADAPDAVFLDIGMPGMDGFEVARKMRQQPGMEKVVLAALTGWGQPEDRLRTLAAGFNHHLVKPPELNSLQTVLAELNRPGTAP